MRDADHKSHRLARKLRKKTPEAEKKLWQKLHTKRLGGAHFRRQHSIKPYMADFACVKAKLIIEVDGWTHSTDEERAYDARRTAFLESKGWTVIRFSNDNIYNDIDSVLRQIEHYLSESAEILDA